MSPASNPKQLWEESFDEQIAKGAYNTAAVEALVRNISYYLRDHVAAPDRPPLHFLEVGCGAGPNLVWLAAKGIRVSGVDIAANALALAERNLGQAGFADRVGELREASATSLPFESGIFDGIIEACVFQHLDREARVAAFREVGRLLKPGGLFVGYMLDVGHSIFQSRQQDELADDPGSLYLADGSSKFHLTNIGTAHFFRREEFGELLDGFSVIDPCLTTYYLPQTEAMKRGYKEYLQSMWTVYAIR
jgi:SAM-dependent methyltransferase